MTTHTPPIASPTIREALEALDKVSGELQLARLALENAAQEEEATTAITRWCKAVGGHVRITPGERIYLYAYGADANIACQFSAAGDSVAHLTLAATWCRKEIEKME